MKRLRNLSWIVLINIFMVIIAGSVVRMTGSGMGCPDWPKCFGYLIPPTSQSQLTWEKEKNFEKGQMVIKNEALWVANQNVTTSSTFEESNWTQYTKHDYAEFNVYHTWTEYINRLFGALLGVFAFALLIVAINKWKVDTRFFWLSLTQFFLIGFEAWLGKLTVDTNLNPNMITYHMIGVTVMIIVQLQLIKLINTKNQENTEKQSSMPIVVNYMALLGIVLMFVQIVLGTQVRQQTDVMFKAGVPRELIADGFDWVFFVHRSFSFLIVFAVLFLFVKLKSNHSLKKVINSLMVFTLLEILAGIVLYYLGMQAYAQPIHLLFSLLIFAFFVEIFLQLRPKKT